MMSKMKQTAKRILTMALICALALGALEITGIGKIGAEEVQAKKIGSKNQQACDACEAVKDGTAPDGYADVLSNGSVYRGGQAQSGVTEGGAHYIDEDQNDFANPLPYGNVFVDTSKLSWSNPANFIIGYQR